MLTYCLFQGPWSEVPAVGLYCMEVEYCSSDKRLISKKINLYPWIRWQPHLSDRVMNLQADTELCNSGVVDSLPRQISCLTVCDVGVMCDIPAVFRHSTDISLEPDNNLSDGNILYKHASASHLEAADGLLSVLSDAVCVRVTCQDAKCHVCLLQQHGADDACKTEASNCYLPGPCSNNTSNSPDKLASGNSFIDFAHESWSDCSLDANYRTTLCDARTKGSNEMIDGSDAVFSCCNHPCYASADQSLCSASLGASSVQVCCISL